MTHIDDFKSQMINILALIPDNRMDANKVIFYQFIKLYPNCILEDNDINTVKCTQTNTFQYTYDIYFSEKLQFELQEKYPEALI